MKKQYIGNNPLRITLEGKSILVHHGDIINLDKENNHNLKRFFRHPKSLSEEKKPSKQELEEIKKQEEKETKDKELEEENKNKAKQKFEIKKEVN